MAQAGVDLHLGTRKLGTIRRIAGRRSRRDSLSSVPGRSLAQGRRRQTAARDLRRSRRRTRLGRPQGAGLQLPHDSLARSGEPGGLPQARALRPRALRTLRPPARRHAEKAGPPARAWAKSSPSSPCPTKRPTSTTTEPSPRTTSARAGTTPTPPTPAARRSGAITRSTPKQLFWFLAHDPRVPPSLQKEVNEWGLAKDEFLDTDHWPNQLYIREARRMVGEYVMSQKDIQTDLTQAGPDRHGLLQQRFAQRAARRQSRRLRAQRRRHAGRRAALSDSVPRPPAQEEPRSQNLLVPVCFSATHVAYSTLRMEPQYMILGQAAGVAAAMAIRRSLARPGYRYRGAHTHPGGTRRHPRVRAHHPGRAGRAFPRQMAPARAKAVE